MAVTPKNRGVLEDAALHHSRLEGGTHVVDHIGRLQVQASPKRIADRTGDAQLGDRGVYKGPSNVVGDGYPLLPFGLSRIPEVNVGSLRLAYQARACGRRRAYVLRNELAAHAKKRFVRAQETDSEELWQASLEMASYWMDAAMRTECLGNSCIEPEQQAAQPGRFLDKIVAGSRWSQPKPIDAQRKTCALKSI